MTVVYPPLSRALKDLEEEIGKPLLIRAGRHIELTQAGMLLRKRAEEILDLVEKTQEKLAGSDDMIAGDVRLGCGETDAMSYLAYIAGIIRGTHPLVRFRLYSGDADRVLERLDRGLIDFGLLIGEVDTAKYEFIRMPMFDTWGVLMRADSPLASKPFVAPEDLVDQPLILSHQVDRNSELAGWFVAQPASEQIVAMYDLVFNASLFVRQGLGYAITLDKLINTSGESELCFRPLNPPLNAQLRLVWKKYQIFSPAVRLFLDVLKEELSKSINWRP